MIVVLIVVAVLAVVERVWRERAHAAERQRLTNAVVAKHGGELIALDRSDSRRPAPVNQERERAKQLDNPLGV